MCFPTLKGTGNDSELLDDCNLPRHRPLSVPLKGKPDEIWCAEKRNGDREEGKKKAFDERLKTRTLNRRGKTNGRGVSCQVVVKRD